MKSDKFKKLTKTSLVVSAVAIGTNLVANDLTPGSWLAQADNHEKTEKSEMQCAEGQCGKKMVEEMKKKKAAKKAGEKQCGKAKKEEKKMKASKKGSDSSCGENTCGA